MMKKKIKILLIIGLFFVSWGGAWLHYAYHPFAKTGYGWVPFIVGLLSMFVVPFLFYFRKTLNLAYLINGFSVIIGIITMTHFSLEIAPLQANIFPLIAKFFIGRAIFCLEVYPLDSDPQGQGLEPDPLPEPGLLVRPSRRLVRWSISWATISGGRTMNKIKWFKPLWWVLHIVAIAVVFWLGHFIQF